MSYKRRINSFAVFVAPFCPPVGLSSSTFHLIICAVHATAIHSIILCFPRTRTMFFSHKTRKQKQKQKQKKGGPSALVRGRTRTLTSGIFKIVIGSITDCITIGRTKSYFQCMTVMIRMVMICCGANFLNSRKSCSA